jgi:hypothetical protein
MIRPVEPTVIVTPSGEEVFVLALTRNQWDALQQQLEKKQLPNKKLKLPNPVSLEGTLTTFDYVQAARD